MSYDKIKALLFELEKELKETEDINDDTKQLFSQFSKKVDANENQNASDITDTALLLEAHFATQHPVAEKLLREIINVLGKMGI